MRIGNDRMGSRAPVTIQVVAHARGDARMRDWGQATWRQARGVPGKHRSAQAQQVRAEGVSARQAYMLG